MFFYVFAFFVFISCYETLVRCWRGVLFNDSLILSMCVCARANRFLCYQRQQGTLYVDLCARQAFIDFLCDIFALEWTQCHSVTCAVLCSADFLRKRHFTDSAGFIKVYINLRLKLVVCVRPVLSCMIYFCCFNSSSNHLCFGALWACLGESFC